MGWAMMTVGAAVSAKPAELAVSAALPSQHSSVPKL
jgi:hypothetical protein